MTDHTDEAADLPPTVHPNFLPCVIDRLIPGAYAKRHLVFHHPDDPPERSPFWQVQVPLAGPQHDDGGVLTAEAIEAAIAVLQQRAAAKNRRCCLVLSEGCAHYVQPDSDKVTVGPAPRGGIRHDECA